MEPGECLTGIRIGILMKKYSVRRPGFASWIDTDSQQVAQLENELANRICCPGHVVVNNHGNERSFNDSDSE